MSKVPKPHPEIPGPEGYPTYYNLPAIRPGHWKWLIITYFWSGGIAGGSYLLAALAGLFGGERLHGIARWGRYLAFVFGTILSPILLILDLGKPARFYNMLRVFKPRSPMSVGTWGLSVFALGVTWSTLAQAARDGLLDWIGPLARVARRLPTAPVEAFGTLLGLFMGGYTGVLISNSAVPLWARNHRTNGPVFLSSALATGAAAITLTMAAADEGTREAERKLDLIQGGAMLVEGALLAYEMKHLGPLRGPLVRGRVAPYFYGAVGAGLVGPLLMGSPSGRGARLAKGALTLAGGFLYRAAVVLGGHDSGLDPQATFYFTDPDHR